MGGRGAAATAPRLRYGEAEEDHGGGELHVGHERDEDEELRLLMERTDWLLATLRANGQDIGRLRSELDTAASTESSSGLLQALHNLELELQQRAVNLGEIHADTEHCHNKHAQRLEEGLRKQREEEAERTQLVRDEASLGQLKADTDAVKWRQNKMQLELEAAMARTPAEMTDKDRELEVLAAQRKHMAVLEADIFNTAKGLQNWKAFAWPEEIESEMNRYGMVGSLSMPAFPEHLLRNPALQAAIAARREELRQLREKLAREAQRMTEICAALAEMEERRQEAELRRMAEQALVWSRDLVPLGPAEFGTVPAFR